MRKVAAHFIYFTEADARELKRLSQRRNESKSAVIRKLVHVEKYADVLERIETNNEIISEFLREFGRLGVNLNQIAYHLNANITGPEEAKNDLEKNMRGFAIAIKELSAKMEDLKIKIDVKHTKTPSGEEEKGDENG